MAARMVFVVRYEASGARLEVLNVGGKNVPMEEFVQSHTPIQVTSLTPYNPGHSPETLGLVIAEEIEEKKKARVL